MTTPGKCDFCSEPPAAGKRSYFAHSQIRLRVEGHGPLTDYIDTGEWVACAECAALIEREDWKGLMDRSAGRNPSFVAACQQGKLLECRRFVAEVWSSVFAVPPEAFL
jgi:hypothetical protein